MLEHAAAISYLSTWEITCPNTVLQQHTQSIRKKRKIKLSYKLTYKHSFHTNNIWKAYSNVGCITIYLCSYFLFTICNWKVILKHIHLFGISLVLFHVFACPHANKTSGTPRRTGTNTLESTLGAGAQCEQHVAPIYLLLRAESTALLTSSLGNQLINTKYSKQIISFSLAHQDQTQRGREQSSTCSEKKPKFCTSSSAWSLQQ